MRKLVETTLLAAVLAVTFTGCEKREKKAEKEVKTEEAKTVEKVEIKADEAKPAEGSK